MLILTSLERVDVVLGYPRLASGHTAGTASYRHVWKQKQKWYSSFPPHVSENRWPAGLQMTQRHPLQHLPLPIAIGPQILRQQKHFGEHLEQSLLDLPVLLL